MTMELPNDLPRMRERQYQQCVEDVASNGFEYMGLATSESWRHDPKHFLFVLSRYKFVAQMLAGSKHVLEVGCGDAMGSRIVRQSVPQVTATDFDPVFVDQARKRQSPPFGVALKVHDFCLEPLRDDFDAAYAVDVLEHIPLRDEMAFIGNIVGSLTNGVLLIGTPSLESQSYASPISREGHVNCKTSADLRRLMGKFFHHVFMFSQNDEVVHTGYAKMAHYLWALCCGIKR